MPVHFPWFSLSLSCDQWVFFLFSSCYRRFNLLRFGMSLPYYSDQIKKKTGSCSCLYRSNCLVSSLFWFHAVCLNGKVSQPPTLMNQKVKLCIKYTKKRNNRKSCFKKWQTVLTQVWQLKNEFTRFRRFYRAETLIFSCLIFKNIALRICFSFLT